jgi:hypothetical protein
MATALVKRRAPMEWENFGVHLILDDLTLTKRAVTGGVQSIPLHNISELNVQRAEGLRYLADRWMLTVTGSGSAWFKFQCGSRENCEAIKRAITDRM